MKSFEFDSPDIDRIETFVSSLYSKLRISTSGSSPTHARIARHAATPDVAFDDSTYSFDMSFTGTPSSTVILGEMVSNTMSRVTEGRENTYGPGDVMLLSRPGYPYRGVVHAARQRVTVLNPALLSRVAAAASNDTRPVHLLGTQPRSGAATRQLRRSIAQLRDIVSFPEAAASPLLLSTASQYLAASILNTFPNTALTEPTPIDHHDGHPATLRRSIAYIEAHAAADIDLLDIATAAHVSPRALQYTFRRHLNMTPMEYLRQVRLDAAHRDLLAADPTQGATVTAIAARWGFAYPSRFAATYRRAYGQHPHTTLHT